MKKWLLVFIIVLLCLPALCLVSCGTEREDYIRIHIRANSNLEADQNVKLEVRDAVIRFLVPFASAAADKNQMMALIRQNISEIKAEADRVLQERNFDYSCEVKLNREEFPRRSYGELTLDAGEYDALIIALGNGEGDNWWCVAFPPLCFIPAESIGGEEVVYKSKIAEWLEKLRN